MVCREHILVGSSIDRDFFIVRTEYFPQVLFSGEIVVGLELTLKRETSRSVLSRTYFKLLRFLIDHEKGTV